MSNEYKYSLCISGVSANDVSLAVKALEAADIVPNMLHVDMLPNGSPSVAYLSTESMMPYGTISCWPASEHEALLHSLSLKHSGILFELSGENIDDPNNGVFKKAFQGGRFREAYIVKQDIDSALEETPWRIFGEPEKEGKEAQVLAMFNKMDSMANSPYFQIASDMVFISNTIEPNEPLSHEDAYRLSSKLNEACGSWITLPALHGEFLDALKALLENGIQEGSYQENLMLCSSISPKNVLKLLLEADEQVFGTLIETKTVENQLHYNDPSISFYKEDIRAVQKAINVFSGGKISLADKIAHAQNEAQIQQQDGKTPMKKEEIQI